MTEKKLAVLAFSGGLDTTYCAMHLAEDLGYEVHTVTVNTGGFDAEALRDIEDHAYRLGARSHITLDRTEEFYQRCLRYLIFGNVLRGNVYPLSVSAERIFQAEAIARYAMEAGADAVAHGSTGAGNDQVRFDSVFHILLPGIPVITPIRDQSLSRDAEIAWLQARGVEMDWSKAAYSVNKGLWGTSIGGRETLTSDQPLPEAAWPTPCVKSGSEEIVLSFQQGELTEINGTPVDAATDAIRKIETIASAYGIGRGMHVGDTIIGLKGRVGFEAAAPQIIIAAHRLLEKHTLTRQQQLLKEQLALTYGSLVHEAQFLEPAARDIERFLAHSQRTVNGSVRILLAPYRFELLGIHSPNDLMAGRFGAYGESNTLWTGDDVRGFSRIYSNQLMMYFGINGDQHDD
ncbi:MAG: argininosuccinate synthase domain-containing protein [Bacteroidota bacterium]|jgi:argininosuccinate synthase